MSGLLKHKIKQPTSAGGVKKIKAVVFTQTSKLTEIMKCQ